MMERQIGIGSSGSWNNWVSNLDFFIRNSSSLWSCDFSCRSYPSTILLARIMYEYSSFGNTL